MKEEILEKLKEWGFEINVKNIEKSIYYNDVFDGLEIQEFNLDFITEVVFKKIFVFWCEKMKEAGKLIQGDHVSFFLNFYLENNFLKIIENPNEVIFKFTNDPLKQIGRIIGKGGQNIKKLSAIVGKRVVIKQ
jgi:hypothetical protein